MLLLLVAAGGGVSEWGEIGVRGVPGRWAGVPRRGGGLGGWSAKAGWGAVGDLLNLVCVTRQLRAGGRRKLAAHLPPEHAVGTVVAAKTGIQP